MLRHRNLRSDWVPWGFTLGCTALGRATSFALTSLGLLILRSQCPGSSTGSALDGASALLCPRYPGCVSVCVLCNLNWLRWIRHPHDLCRRFPSPGVPFGLKRFRLSGSSFVPSFRSPLACRGGDEQTTKGRRQEEWGGRAAPPTATDGGAGVADGVSLAPAATETGRRSLPTEAGTRTSPPRHPLTPLRAATPRWTVGRRSGGCQKGCEVTDSGPGDASTRATGPGPGAHE